jgi:hypothetical protein
MAVWQEWDKQDFHFQKHTFRAREVFLEKGGTADNTSRNEIRPLFALTYTNHIYAIGIVNIMFIYRYMI